MEGGGGGGGKNVPKIDYVIFERQYYIILYASLLLALPVVKSHYYTETFLTGSNALMDFKST